MTEIRILNRAMAIAEAHGSPNDTRLIGIYKTVKHDYAATEARLAKKLTAEYALARFREGGASEPTMKVMYKVQSQGV